MDLFDHAAETDPAGVPLAERLRPRRLADVVGQAHLTGTSSILARTLKQGRVPSIVLWGPPGTGKTTIAACLGHEARARVVKVSAVLAGVADIRKAIDDARRLRAEHRQGTILFIDEIHRFNKSQQDALLPHVEQGTVVLVGATTENPSFAVNPALLSRCRVLVLKPVTPEALGALLDRALTDERGLKDRDVTVDDVARRVLIAAAAGDARKLLTSLEVASDLCLADGRTLVERADVEMAVQRRVLLYDKDGEQHYDVVSAFIKSMRGSDPDAALYWGFRMIDAGEDPLFILRRMVIFASEDIGNADPMALVVATSALTAFQLTGLPEGAIPLAHAITYLASAPKSNASYVALHAARRDVHAYGPLPVPLHLRNAPTRLMEQLGYGKEYCYPHDHEGGVVAEHYLPEALRDRSYYQPKDIGAEAHLRERLAAAARARAKG
ncbi:MAG: replication-associated recombination protein A [Deltaproteobacteria bacterium]|nr:replication-associated recombination protein A [Deltaproteobacteria bacterium]